jgi:succinate dehydrogenase hydrophobic anchor subunit
MSVERLQGVDLFDDPSWDSDDGKAYDRMGVSGFSPLTESAVALVALGIFVLSVALSMLFFRTLNDVVQQFSQMLIHVLDGLRL